MPKPIIKGGEYTIFLSNSAMRDILLKYQTVSEVLSESDIEIIKSIMKEGIGHTPKSLIIIDNELRIYNPLTFQISKVTLSQSDVILYLSMSLIADIRTSGSPITTYRVLYITMSLRLKTNNFEINVNSTKIVNSDE